MIPALLVAAVGTVGSMPAPSQHVALGELQGIGIEVFLDVGPTHFKAENPSPFDYLLVLGTQTDGVVGQMVLHAGSSLGYEFPEGVLDGLSLDILANHGGIVQHTGALPLGELVHQGNTSLWIQSSPNSVLVWLEQNTGFDLVSPTAGILPDRAGLVVGKNNGRTAPLESNLIHVPVIDPEDEEEPEEEDGPPVIEPKPLPPI